MPFGLQDIFAAGNLAFKLHSWGSSRYTSAYQEYQDFMRDVNNVAVALQAIQSEVDSYDGFSDQAGRDLASLDLAVGGVLDTLTRCEKLLRDNPKFQWREGFVVNVVWNVDLAEHVKTLQTRIQFHCTKLNLVIQPLQLHIQRCLGQLLRLIHSDMDARFKELEAKLMDIDRSLSRAGHRSQRQPERSRTVFPQLAEHFESAASTKTSTGLNEITDCLDAVVFHHRDSTWNFMPIPPTTIKPTALQYTNLLKCLWILQRVRHCQYFRVFRSDTLSEAYLRQLDRQIESELQRFEGFAPLHAPDITELLSQPVESFEIWPDLGIIDSTPAITEAHGLELELLKAPLQALVNNRQQELVVFRAAENHLRLAIVITSSNVAVTERNNYELDCRKAVLIPLYAHPSNQASNSICWKSAPEDPRLRELPFRDRSKLVKFQEAVTNFGVVADFSNLTSVKHKGSWKKFDGKHGTELGGRGCAQIWLYRKPPASNRSSRHDSMLGAGNSGTDASSTRAWSQNYAQKQNPSSTLRSNPSGGYLDPPVPAQLVLFTLYRNQLRLISIKINGRTKINKDRCDCGNKKKATECKRIVVESDEGVAIKYYEATSATTGEDLSSFNVALLRHPPHDHAEHNVEHFTSSFVSLEFETPVDRQRLSDCFETAASVVSTRTTSYWKDYKNLRNLHVYTDNDVHG